MGTDSNFVANDGSSVTTGMMSWGTKDFSSTFVTGVWGLGKQWGVLGQIDDLSPSPSFPVSTGASYLIPSAVIGATPMVTGVGGQSDTGVGVFGQAGAFAKSLPSGLNCGVLGTSAGSAGVMGFSDSNSAVDGTSDSGAGVSGTSTKSIGVLGKSGSVGLVGSVAFVQAGVVGTSDQHLGVVGTSN